MTAHVYSATTTGFEAKLIDVECDASNGLPNLLIVGLGNKAIDEAKERVRSAIKNSGLEFPRKRVTINLAPANLPKDGAHFDLPIALALLCVSGQISQDSLRNVLVVGELGLDGSLRPVRGIIGHVEAAQRAGIQSIIIPKQSHAQASLIKDTSLLPASSLKEVFDYLQHNIALTPPELTESKVTNAEFSVSINDIHGQDQAKRALLIAAAGHHNILFDGPPGAGKTMLAKALVSILPSLAEKELIEVTKLHSIAGETDEQIITQRPFRSPHHSASHISLIGGGQNPKPGEISLAHRGVLFLDELPEYSRASLEALRQPLEDKVVHITRANGRVTFPADFMLVATQNPCPCGYATDQTQACTCSMQQITNYQKKVSGPLLDRIDLVVQVSKVEHDKLLTRPVTRYDYARAIKQARTIQAKRFNSLTKLNATLTNKEIQAKALFGLHARTLLDKAAGNLHLSARAYFKVIKIARTIADLENSPSIEPNHVSEALQYRYRPH